LVIVELSYVGTFYDGSIPCGLLGGDVSLQGLPVSLVTIVKSLGGVV